MFYVTIANLRLIKESVVANTSYHEINYQIHMKIANRRVIYHQQLRLPPRRITWSARPRSYEITVVRGNSAALYAY